MAKSDMQIQQDVLRELHWDTHVDETEVGVQVKAGVVTLAGNVSSWGKRAAAQEAAHRVTGVLDVANDLRVKLPGVGARSDSELAQAVRHALEWDVFVPDTHIKSTVTDGVVTLEGTVDYGNQSADAERAVRNLSGVSLVLNRIQIIPPKVRADDVRRSIEGALERQAEHEAQNVKIDVEDSRVTLRGTVHSWAEKDAALAAARATQGVRMVDDQLEIRASAP